MTLRPPLPTWAPDDETDEISVAGWLESGLAVLIATDEDPDDDRIEL